MSLLTQFYPGPGGGGDTNIVAQLDGGTAGSAILCTGPAGFTLPTLSSPAGTWETTQYSAYAVSTGVPIIGGATGTSGVTITTISANNSVYFSKLPDGILSITLGGSITSINNLTLYLNASASLSNAANALASINTSRIYVGSGTYTVSSTALTDTTTSVILVGGGGNLNMNGTSLSSASVDKILTDIVDANLFTGTINLAGGCTAPGAAGTAAIAILTTRGYTVNTN